MRQGGTGSTGHLAPGVTNVGVSSNAPPPQGYFDNAGNYTGKEKSTVGSASATGSIGGRTTWASESDMYDADKMSEDQDDGVSSSAGLSDEGNASLVGFGEGASSTMSGPISTSGRIPGGAVRGGSGLASPNNAKPPNFFPRDAGSPMQGLETQKPKMYDGMTFDRDGDPASAMSRTAQSRNANMTGQENAERIVRERLAEGDR